jgi:hypothetical protein
MSLALVSLQQLGLRIQLELPKQLGLRHYLKPQAKQPQGPLPLS